MLGWPQVKAISAQFLKRAGSSPGGHLQPPPPLAPPNLPDQCMIL